MKFYLYSCLDWTSAVGPTPLFSTNSLVLRSVSASSVSLSVINNILGTPPVAEIFQLDFSKNLESNCKLTNSTKTQLEFLYGVEGHFAITPSWNQQYIFAASWSGTLIQYDISNVSAPFISSSMNLHGPGYHVATSQSYLAVLVASDFQSNIYVCNETDFSVQIYDSNSLQLVKTLKYSVDYCPLSITIRQSSVVILQLKYGTAELLYHNIATDKTMKANFNCTDPTICFTTGVVLDNNGEYAYLSFAYGDILKINLANLSIVQTYTTTSEIETVTICSFIFYLCILSLIQFIHFNSVI